MQNQLQAITTPTIERRPGETAKHLSAFFTYALMGKERNLRSLATTINVCSSNVLRWSQRFEWASRVERFDAESELMLKELTLQQLTAQNKKLLDLIDETIELWRKNLQTGQISLNATNDLERLLNMRSKLLGTDPIELRSIQVNYFIGNPNKVKSIDTDLIPTIKKQNAEWQRD